MSPPSIDGVISEWTLPCGLPAPGFWSDESREALEFVAWQDLNPAASHPVRVLRRMPDEYIGQLGRAAEAEVLGSPCLDPQERVDRHGEPGGRQRPRSAKRR